MNRRGFLNALLKAGAGFSILPPATTYARIWRAQRFPDLQWKCAILPTVNHYGDLGIRAQLQACSLTMAKEEILTPAHFRDLFRSESRVNQILTDRATAQAIHNALFGDRSRDKIA